ncbi:hypothetical protein BR93DRAFT_965730 [Coniochaeta sp. PMI_546]|nr:hypothetical protein BR93DRAFT_965730 [Coniochaeta sp. PMI_546]
MSNNCACQSRGDSLPSLARPRNDLISKPYKTAETPLPDGTYHYDDVSVLLTYWAMNDYLDTVRPALDDLQSLLSESYGFNTQMMIIPSRPEPEAALLDLVRNFVEEGDNTRRHLMIVCYAGHQSVNGRDSGRPGTQDDDAWRIDWTMIGGALMDFEQYDVLFLLGCHVSEHWIWESQCRGGRNAIEMIHAPKYTARHFFTKAITYAFERIHDLSCQRQLQLLTTGVLFRRLLEYYEECNRDAPIPSYRPVHLIFNQGTYRIAVQLQNMYRRDTGRLNHKEQLHKANLRLEDIKRQHDSVLRSVNDLLDAATSHIIAIRSQHGLDALSRSAKLKHQFEQLDAETSRLGRFIHQDTYQQVDLVWNLHTLLESVKDLVLPAVIDGGRRWNDIGDCDQPTVEHIEDCDQASHDWKWETTDDESSQDDQDTPSEDLDRSQERCGSPSSCCGDGDVSELVRGRSRTQRES